MFDKLKIPYKWRKTKSGQYATDEEKLAELDGQHPIIGEILNHRGLSKLKSTYVDALPNMVNPNTKRIHSSFNQALTATGRLSSNNPNLQNIPIRTEEGAKVREAFIPRDENHVLVAADYSQIELRIIAEISGDEGMLEAFQRGRTFTGQRRPKYLAFLMRRFLKNKGIGRKQLILVSFMVQDPPTFQSSWVFPAMNRKR